MPVCRRSKMMNSDQKANGNSEKTAMELMKGKLRVASPQGGEPEKHPLPSPVGPSSGSSRIANKGVSILSEGSLRRGSHGGDSERGDEKKVVRFSMESNVEVLAFEELDWMPTTSRGPRRTFGGELQQNGGAQSNGNCFVNFAKVHLFLAFEFDSNCQALWGAWQFELNSNASFGAVFDRFRRYFRSVSAPFSLFPFCPSF